MSDAVVSRRRNLRRGLKTVQEKFWVTEFGNSYVGRNAGRDLVASNVVLFANALRLTQGIRDCIEFGANIGLNLQALQILYPDIHSYAIEINAVAAKALEKVVPNKNIYCTSILDYVAKQTHDLVIAKGILIHINPNYLSSAYEKLYRSCGRYLLICEYYNPTPVSVPYRGYKDRLFKRDFAGNILDKYSDLKLLDYGFTYHRDPNFPQDDVNWFLLEKRSKKAT